MVSVNIFVLIMMSIGCIIGAVNAITSLLDDKKRQKAAIAHTITLDPGVRLVSVTDVNGLHSRFIVRKAKSSRDLPSRYECVDGIGKVILIIVEQ